MNKQEEFYVGYQDEAPKGQAKFIRRIIYIILGLVILVSLVFSLGQKAFVNSTFELGSLREIEGTFYHSPYPTLRVKFNEDHEKDIMLVGFGKFGVDQSFGNSGISDQLPKDGSVLNLTGTMIYYDGKALFQTEANLEGTYEVLSWNEFQPEQKSLGVKTLEGEIVYPKCYFGVMKPGYGKIHRSCATRCLSGGIPPVLVTTDLDGFHEYYVLTDSEGNKLGAEFLSYVGKPSSISGEVLDLGEWKQMRVITEEIKILAERSEIYE